MHIYNYNTPALIDETKPENKSRIFFKKSKIKKIKKRGKFRDKYVSIKPE